MSAAARATREGKGKRTEGSIEVLPLTRTEHAAAWEQRELASRFFLWDAFVGGVPRVASNPLLLGSSLHQAAIQAATEVTAIVSKAALRAFDDDVECARYGFHPDVVRLASASHRAGDEASLVRVDLLLDDSCCWRVCEINADCPGGHNEAVALPYLARRAGIARGTGPAILIDALANRLSDLADPARSKGRASVCAAASEPEGGRASQKSSAQEPSGAVALIYATAYAEDLQVCALVQRALEERGVHAVLCPPTAPRGEGDHLYVGDKLVRALYRFFPCEYMEGQRNIEALVRAVESGSVRTLSSFAQIFPQSKLALARAHALRALWSDAERETLRQHLPETFDIADIAADDLISHRASWVIKKALGRVGEEVFVGPLFDDLVWKRLVVGVKDRRPSGEVWIAQRFVPQKPIPTPWGERFVTLGVYLLDGEFAGYFARVTPESHVSHDALCLPVFFEGSLP